VDRTVIQVDRWGNHTTRRLKGRILKPGIIRRSGSSIHLFVKMPGNQTLFVHRAVLEAFKGPCPPGMEACHYNDVGTDNRIENLRWDTRKGNKRDEVRNGLNFNARKIQCKHGHEFTPENTISKMSRNGRPRRDCRKCQAEAMRRFKAKHRGPLTLF
jgi:hypothetical protein